MEKDISYHQTKKLCTDLFITLLCRPHFFIKCGCVVCDCVLSCVPNVHAVSLITIWIFCINLETACKLICTFQLLHVFVILIQCFLNVQQNAVTKSIGDGRPLNLLDSIHNVDLQKSSLHFIGRFYF